MTFRRILLFLLLFIVTNTFFKLFGESVQQKGFNNLENPFAGGLNATHFAVLDIDLDGKNDIIAFDKTASVISVFLQTDRGYTYSDEYNEQLPPVSSFIQTADLNNDGRKDILTFNGISGINVYFNLSKSTLKFGKPVTLMANMYGSFTPLYCTSVDYPLFTDINGDGRVDVLNFWVASASDYLLYYRNLDSTHFEVVDWSWGCFSEGEDDNTITLNDCAEAPNTAGATITSSQKISMPKHTGSTLSAIKNNQGLYDLLLGDVGYKGLYYLHNGGTVSNARITSYDTISTPFEFPVVSSVIINDTFSWLVSPFTSNPFTTTGNNNILRVNPQTKEIVQNDFLQNTMFDFGILSRPCAMGGNILIGSYDEGISLITESATKINLWNLKERLNSKALSPAYNNSTQDLFVGMENGRIALVRDSIIIDTFFAGIQVGSFAAPTLFDIDNNGLIDLIIGEKRSGKLYCYYNENGIFNTIPDTLKGVDIQDRNYSNFGYGTPAFARDEQNQTMLFCGSEQGIIYEYKLLEKEFEKVAEYNLNTGKFAAPAIVLASPVSGGKNLIVGNIRGGLQIFDLENLPSTSIENQPNTISPSPVNISTNPVINGILNVLSEEKAKYIIYDISGKIMQQGLLHKGRNTINLRQRKTAMYIFYFKTENLQSGTIKFIIGDF